jgi:hypothetical protein
LAQKAGLLEVGFLTTGTKQWAYELFQLYLEFHDGAFHAAPVPHHPNLEQYE